MKKFKDFLNEQKQLNEASFAVEVSVRDARKANDLAQDSYRGLYNNDGSNVFIFKKESDKEDFVDGLLDMNLEILDDFIINKSKGDFLTKKQKDFLNSFKKLYNIDLFEFVDKWRTTKKLVTISTYDISNNDLTNLERFCHDRRVRYEPNGHNALSIWV